MEVNEDAATLGQIATDVTRFLMHGCCDVGAICDVEGHVQTFNAHDPCFLVALGDDEFAVASQSGPGYHEPQIIIFYVNHDDPERISDAIRVDATEHNILQIAHDLKHDSEINWNHLNSFNS